MWVYVNENGVEKRYSIEQDRALMDRLTKRGFRVQMKGRLFRFKIPTEFDEGNLEGFITARTRIEAAKFLCYDYPHWDLSPTKHRDALCVYPFIKALNSEELKEFYTGYFGHHKV
jgi:hypothetical protein